MAALLQSPARSWSDERGWWRRETTQPWPEFLPDIVSCRWRMESNVHLSWHFLTHQWISLVWRLFHHPSSLPGNIFKNNLKKYFSPSVTESSEVVWVFQQGWWHHWQWGLWYTHVELLQGWCWHISESPSALPRCRGAGTCPSHWAVCSHQPLCPAPPEPSSEHQDTWSYVQNKLIDEQCLQPSALPDHVESCPGECCWSGLRSS